MMEVTTQLTVQGTMVIYHIVHRSALFGNVS